jgi:general secretion pathway protein G
MRRHSDRGTSKRGFTLIELLVVLSVIAALLSIVAPNVFDSLERAKEAALRSDLKQMREAIDKHYADTGRWPTSLEELATARYLRQIPADPMTDRNDTWLVLSPPDGVSTGVYDVRSGAQGAGRDGTAFSSW